MNAKRAVLLATFSAALGYGMLLPLLPLLLSASANDSLEHMAALPTAFLLAAALTAPLWGALSDRVRRSRVLLAGLFISAAAGVPFLAEPSLLRLYVFQVLAGVGSSAVAPAALAIMYESQTGGARGEGIAWFGTALLLGYLAGPAVAGWVAHGAAPLHGAAIALGVQAVLAAAAALFVFGSRVDDPVAAPPPAAASAAAPLRTAAPALLAAFALGGFEIGVVLYVRSPLHEGPRTVAELFTACSAGMIAAQIGLLPRLVPRSHRLRPALFCIGVSGALVALIGFVRWHAALVAIAAAQGAALGLAIGLLRYDAAAFGAAVRGRVLGWQNAAINVGQAAGSAAAALAFLALGGAGLPAFGAAVVSAGAVALVREGRR